MEEDGETPLMIAANEGTVEGHFLSGPFSLIDHGSIFMQHTTHAHAHTGALDYIRLLVERGANLHAVNKASACPVCETIV